MHHEQIYVIAFIAHDVAQSDRAIEHEAVEKHEATGRDVDIVGHKGEHGTVYADATVTNGTVTYYIFSPSITAPTATQEIQFWFRRIGYQYEIKLEIVS